MIKVSVIIPCRNEERHIRKCLNSLLTQDYPKEKMEILVVNGMSKDGTREILEEYSRKYDFLKILENPKKIIPSALNIGIKKAKNDIIIRMDAHATYQKDYISKCVKYLDEYKVDNVGGTIKTLPGKNTIVAKTIALSLSHPFGVGSSYFRKGVKKSREVDTVFGGCYKREIFDKIGFFNENLVGSEDIEFNYRLRKVNRKIFLFPDIVSNYYVKSTTFKEFFDKNLIDGIWAVYPSKFIEMPFSIRHYIPLLFVLSLIATTFMGLFFPIFFQLFLLIIGLYLLVNFYCSLQIALKERKIVLFFLMPIAFATRHFGYGLGSIFGFHKIFKLNLR